MAVSGKRRYLFEYADDEGSLRESTWKGSRQTPLPTSF